MTRLIVALDEGRAWDDIVAAIACVALLMVLLLYFIASRRR